MVPDSSESQYSVAIPNGSEYIACESRNALHELITPSEDVFQLLLQSHFVASHETGISPVFLIHAKSMQTEKTKQMQLFAWKLRHLGLSCAYILPGNGVGDPSQKGKAPEKGYMVSRAFPFKKEAAEILLTNSLVNITKQLEDRGITKKTTDVLVFDEIQLFVDQSSFEAVSSILFLQKLGYIVLMNGIDYDFRSFPFSHMHHQLLMSMYLPGWQAFELQTKCRHCSRPAEGSRRVLKMMDGEEQIADDTSPLVMPSLSSYYAVCDINHKSCRRSASNEPFQKQEIPTLLSELNRHQILWMKQTLQHFNILS